MQQPRENVHVVAALGEDHGRSIRGLVPVSANVAVRIVPVTNILGVVDMYDLADRAAVQKLPDLPVEFRVAHHMADQNSRVLFFRELLQLQALLQARGNGLFQQNGVAQLNGLAGVGKMLVVLRGNDHGVSQLRPAEQLLGGAEFTRCRDLIVLHEFFPAAVVRVCNGREADLIAVELRVGSITVLSAFPGADQRQRDFLIHI